MTEAKEACGTPARKLKPDHVPSDRPPCFLRKFVRESCRFPQTFARTVPKIDRASRMGAAQQGRQVCSSGAVEGLRIPSQSGILIPIVIPSVVRNLQLLERENAIFTAPSRPPG